MGMGMGRVFQEKEMDISIYRTWKVCLYAYTRVFSLWIKFTKKYIYIEILDFQSLGYVMTDDDKS